MKKLKALASKLASVLPALALVLGVATLNSACFIAYYQPEVSSDLDAYRK